MGPGSLSRFRQLQCENMTQTPGYWSTLTVSNHESTYLAAGASLQTSVLITDEQWQAHRFIRRVSIHCKCGIELTRGQKRVVL